MAPNKKKKKLASSSNRGFATTSAPSKNKKQDAEISAVDAPNSSEARIGGDHSSSDALLSSPQKESEAQHSELSPEKLGHQLETSELQMLVDKYGENVKKTSSRQVSKLNTERRVFRTQAVQMRLSQRLPSELVLLIIESLIAQENQLSRYPALRSTNRDNFPNESEDKLLVKFWTLHRLLPQLGFSDSHRDDVLRGLLNRKQAGTIQTVEEVKDSPWGLEFCLNFLARCTGSEGPSKYDVNNDVLMRHRVEPKAWDGRTPLSTPDESRPSTPSSHLAMGSQPATLDPDTANTSPEVTPETDSELDSDIEPDEMIEKYIEWHTRRFRLSSQNAEYAVTSGRTQKRHNLAIDTIERRVVHLDSKIARMKSDILFNHDEAERQWAATRINLAREAADRRRLGIDEDVKRQMRNEEILATEENDEEATMLGEFFSNLPETKSLGDDTMTVTSSTGVVTRIRDFGKWNGLSPRRILEEVCRARDSSSKVNFKLLSETTFSNRHQVQVQWSRDQEIVSPISIEGVLCEIGNRRVSAEMETVACPEVSQSEAFISTISLFIIFGSSVKEGKAHLRLPSVWRTLWGELTLLRKQQIDNIDIQTLRELRATIAEHTSHDVTNDKIIRNAKIALPTDPLLASENLSVNGSSLVDAENLKSSWAQKSSTERYRMMLGARQSLPIWGFKQELLHAFDDNQVVIVCGETGCGKSTQVPAYLLEHELSSGRPCRIYCTEPRRISATSLARRVSEELGERKGDVGTSRSVIGFAVRLDNQVTRETRLVYATTGIVMRMLETTKGLDEVTHLVLDEVHERSIESDFLLIILRKLMVMRPTLKVVLMSATVDAEQFSSYLGGAPVLNIPGRTFPVETRFLEDAVEATRFRDRGISSEIPPEEDEQDEDVPPNSKTTEKANIKDYSISTRETLAKLDEYRINYDLIVKLLEVIATDLKYADYRKAILIFLPGIAEIRRLNDMLVGNQIFSHGWNVLMLHSTIAMEDQERAFLVPPEGVHKIVVATNIAETGITIPDVTCVIDAGKHKEMRFDERKQISRLVEAFCSRANAKQRRGRAGRVQKGLCFHLFTKHRHDALLPEQQTPEMLRLSLQDLVLRVKICKLGGVAQTLAEALDPPSAKNVQRAIDALIDVKALTATEDLTSLGRQLARLPLDVFLGKLVLLGTIFGCLDGTLTIAAILSSKSPFSAPVNARNQGDLARLHFKKGDSDLLTVYNAYYVWRRICTTSHGMSEQQFCHRNFLNAQTLSNIEEMKGQLLSSLVEANFVVLNQYEKQALNRVRSYSRHRNFVLIPAQYNNNADNDLILNSVIACSFYPRLLKRDGKGWRNIASNQSVSLHPTSVNKSVDRPPEWLSFYHIMQSSNKFYNAHETSAVEDIAIALFCGDAEFKMYSGVIVIDGNRVRFAVDDWNQMLAIKTLRTQVQEIMTQAFKHPGKQLSETQRGWLDVLQRVFAVEEKRK